jgi:hypothetical protein
LPLFIPISTASVALGNNESTEKDHQTDPLINREYPVKESNSQEPSVEESPIEVSPTTAEAHSAYEPIPPQRDEGGKRAVGAEPVLRGRATNHQKLILKSRSKKDRKRFTGSLRQKRGESVKLAPTYKILPKREDAEESVTFKTRNPKARAKIKKVMERWEPK